MVKVQLFLVFSTLCYFSAHATHYYDLDLKEDDPPTPAAEIAFSQLYSAEQYMNYERRARPRRQVSGGVIVYPGGETRTIGYMGRPFSGSLSQTVNSRGFTNPVTYGGGVGFSSPGGHGVSGKVNVQHGIGGQGSVRGHLGLVSTPGHQISGWAQHNRNLDKNFNIVGRETNSAGLTYSNANRGSSAFVSGSHTPGQPNTGSVGVGGNIPLATGNVGRIRLEGAA